MTATVTRTANDDLAAVLTQLDALTREVANWRAHLLHLQAVPEPGVAMQVRHSARVVDGTVADAVSRSAELCFEAESNGRS